VKRTLLTGLTLLTGAAVLVGVGLVELAKLFASAIEAGIEDITP